MKCECHFCLNGTVHPSRHTRWHSISDQLLVAESLDPRDSVPMRACGTCGHKEPARP